MKTDKSLLIIFWLIGCIAFSGCFSAITKQNKAEKAILKNEKLIDNNANDINEKGKSFVWGAGYALSHETNITPALDVGTRFIDLAQLTLGNPSFKDSLTIRAIVDDLLSKYQLDLATKEDEISKYKKQILKGEAALAQFSAQVVALEGDRDKLTEKYDLELDKARKVAGENAEKAAKFDSEHGFWQSFNIFSDIFSLMRKLLVLGLIIGALVIIFHILEIFFPGLGVVTYIFSLGGRIVQKFFPRAIDGAGFVTKKVLFGFQQVIKGIQDTRQILSKQNIEDKILEIYPYDKTFNKDEVKKLLIAHTDRIQEILEGKLKEHTDNESRILITQTKTDLGLKS